MKMENEEQPFSNTFPETPSIHDLLSREQSTKRDFHNSVLLILRGKTRRDANQPMYKITSMYTYI